MSPTVSLLSLLVEPDHSSREFDATDEVILDAVVDELRHLGLRRLTVEGVADRAGVSRITVHRRFTSRDRLVALALDRETHRILDHIAEADDPAAAPVDRIARSFAAAVDAAHRHPLIDHWLTRDPGQLLRHVLADDEHTIRTGRAFLVQQLLDAGAMTDPDPAAVERVADLVVRLYFGLVLMPPPALGTPDRAEAYARQTIAPMVLALFRGGS